MIDLNSCMSMLRICISTYTSISLSCISLCFPQHIFHVPAIFNVFRMLCHLDCTHIYTYTLSKSCQQGRGLYSTWSQRHLPGNMVKDSSLTTLYYYALHIVFWPMVLAMELVIDQLLISILGSVNCFCLTQRFSSTFPF